MIRNRRALTLLAAATLLLAACGETTDETTDAGDAPAAAAAVLEVADSPLGAHLVDGQGLTVYLFDNDSPGVSTCTDDCLANWPAVTVDGELTVGDGVDASLVDTIEREDDGTTQLTYAGMPLYLWVGDAAPGDAEGQGVNDVWWVVAPDGTAITAAAEADMGGGYGDY